MEKFNFSARLENLLKKISDENIDAVLITKTANLFYFSGFRGDSAVLLISKNFCKLITDGRYTEQAQKQTENFEVVQHEEGLFKKIADEIKNCGVKKLGFEGRNISFADYNYLNENLSEVELKSVELDSLRQIKDDAEIFLIRRACEIADKAFAEILNFIKVGRTENEIAAELEYLMRKFGAEKNSFDTIVASGVRGSLPHGIASEKKICDGEFITMDFGAIYGGYCSDMTRTICVGNASDKWRNSYNEVLNAQLHGLEVIKIGVSGKFVDEAVRNKLKTAELDKYFSHALGHSLGIEIHEEPRLSPLSKCESLQKNMLVTDEPGIYIPNEGGIRIEDTVLITENGAETLTKSPKNLIEIL
ncbi:MAG: aminopeptidase P family protein [Selenomonadaceae bacterium]|nr:aminopeptidase P family protein [Selenomonadaceae bacterium]